MNFKRFVVTDFARRRVIITTRLSRGRHQRSSLCQYGSSVAEDERTRRCPYELTRAHVDVYKIEVTTAA